MTEYLNDGKGQEMPLTDLHLGDCVQAFDGPYGTAIVKKIDNDIVTFFRPYGAHEHFSYSGGVICYVGIEEFSRGITARETIHVWRRERVV